MQTKQNESKAEAPQLTPFRVLHIGNVANNAYLNSKILRDYGIESDVICYDYYHIMGCPEWEDADFHGDFGDDFYPEWGSVDLNGFRRPRWFAQGRLNTAIQYLSAYRRSRRLKATLLWWKLRCECWIKSLIHRGDAPALMRVLDVGRSIKRKCSRLKAGVGCIPHPIHLLRRVFSTKAAKQSNCHMSPNCVQSFGTIDSLIQQFQSRFPQRHDLLCKDDFIESAKTIARWRRLLEQYDVVIGYATDPILPLIAGFHPVIAFEHGTLRSIPFESNAQGRRTAISYAMADATLITNCDNKGAAERLGISNYRFVPHPVNEHMPAGLKAPALVEQLREEKNSDFIIFHPSRQHWDKHPDPSWEKANDVLIHGFSLFVHKCNPRATAIFVEWGRSVDKSKALLRELGIEDRVSWIQPEPHCRMIGYLRYCDATADQFYLGAFGSITPKALLHGSPVILHFNEGQHQWAFPEMPPVVSARTPDQVFEGLNRLYFDKEYRSSLSRQGQLWYRRYHSSHVVGQILINQCQQVLYQTSDVSPEERRTPDTIGLGHPHYGKLCGNIRQVQECTDVYAG